MIFEDDRETPCGSQPISLVIMDAFYLFFKFRLVVEWNEVAMLRLSSKHRQKVLRNKFMSISRCVLVPPDSIIFSRSETCSSLRYFHPYSFFTSYAWWHSMGLVKYPAGTRRYFLYLPRVALQCVSHGCQDTNWLSLLRYQVFASGQHTDVFALSLQYCSLRGQ